MKKVKARYYNDAHKTIPAELANYASLALPVGRQDQYEVAGIVGRGKYAIVLQGVHAASRERVAIKVFSHGNKRKVRREVAVLLLLKDAPSVQGFRELVRNVTNNGLCLVTDHYMFDAFEDYYQKFTLRSLQTYMQRLLQALDYIHSKGVIHRDIKPQNVLYSFKTQRMKIIDFGLAEFYHPDKQFSPQVASKFFKAPELLLNYPYYNYAVDVWAAGIIFISIIFRRFPFFLGADLNDQLTKLVEFFGAEEFVKYQFTYGKTIENRFIGMKKKHFNEFVTPKNSDLATPEALDLAAKLLAFDFSARISAKDALNHPFFKL